MNAIEKANKLMDEVRESKKFGNEHTGPMKEVIQLVEDLLIECNEQKKHIVKLEKLIVLNAIKDI